MTQLLTSSNSGGTVVPTPLGIVSITGGTVAGLTGFAVRNAGTGAFDMTVAHNGTMTAARTLTLDLNDGSRIVSLSGDLTVSGAANISGTHSGTSSGNNSGDQTITLTGAVTGGGTSTFATTLATPGTLTVGTSNSNATAHTHAITSSSAPGAAASLLATDASGIIGSTGTRIVKGWFTDLTVTNAIAGSVTGNAATVTTNANLTGVITSSGNATSITSQTGTGTKFVVDNTPTITTPVIAGGLTASGAGSITFVGSSATFITSTGANTLSGATTITDATTPSLTTAAGKTNTGFVQINGKTSGALKLMPVDAAAQTVTVSLAAQTTGAATLTIPDMASVSDTVALLTKAQTITSKTLESSTIGVTTAASGRFTTLETTGRAGIGVAPAANVALYNLINITGGTSAYGHLAQHTVASDVTVAGVGFSTSIGTQAAAFTASVIRHFEASQATIGSGSAVTSQYGFVAGSSLTGATNNYGFYADIASGSNRWNFYANGTAASFFGGTITSNAGITSFNATAIGAGANTQYAAKFSSTANFGVFYGSGAPTFTAAANSLYLRSDGSTTTTRLYINTTGSTTWATVTTSA